jgi:hypothetical protein
MTPEWAADVGRWRRSGWASGRRGNVRGYGSCGELLDGRPRWSENSDESRTASLAGLMGLRGLARAQCEPQGRVSHAGQGRELGVACCVLRVA